MLPRRVSVAVSQKEYRALKWVAEQALIRRYPHGTGRTVRPGMGAILRTKSIAQALAEYEAAKAAKAATSDSAQGEQG